MTVRQENVVSRNGIHINGSCQRVAGHEGVEKDRFPPAYDAETGMSVVAELHGNIGWKPGGQKYAFACIPGNNISKKLLEG
jgi:hypothetical protein